MPALDDAVVVVTGGSRGIGRAIACAMARAGAQIALCARTEHELEEGAAAVRAAAAVAIQDRSRRVVALPCDIARSDDVKRFARAVSEQLGEPSVLVNNAAIVARGRLDEQSIDEWRAVVDVNLHGTFLVTRAFLPAMRRARAGRIINIASISGRQGTALHTAYCASKHAVVGLTRALAEEVRDEGIQVNAICPGSVDTRMLEGSGFAPDMTPGDIARAALFLAGDAPDALTGACLDVFG